MEIKITSILPLMDEIRPPVGSIHKVIRKTSDRRNNRFIYWIKFKNTEIGVFPRECEIVKESVTNE